jgi:hypothetical protein
MSFQRLQMNAVPLLDDRFLSFAKYLESQQTKTETIFNFFFIKKKI